VCARCYGAMENHEPVLGYLGTRDAQKEVRKKRSWLSDGDFCARTHPGGDPIVPFFLWTMQQHRQQHQPCSS